VSSGSRSTNSCNSVFVMLPILVCHVATGHETSIVGATNTWFAHRQVETILRARAS
jgi:hypothetical protein